MILTSNWYVTHESDADRPRARTLQDTLVIANAGLGVAASEAVTVTGDSAEDIGTMEQRLRDLSGGEKWD